MELIDDIKDKIDEGIYLRLCNEMKKLYEKKDTTAAHVEDVNIAIWMADMIYKDNRNNAKAKCIAERIKKILTRVIRTS